MSDQVGIRQSGEANFGWLQNNPESQNKLSFFQLSSMLGWRRQTAYTSVRSKSYPQGETSHRVIWFINGVSCMMNFHVIYIPCKRRTYLPFSHTIRFGLTYIFSAHLERCARHRQAQGPAVQFIRDSQIKNGKADLKSRGSCDNPCACCSLDSENHGKSGLIFVLSRQSCVLVDPSQGLQYDNRGRLVHRTRWSRERKQNKQG